MVRDICYLEYINNTYAKSTIWMNELLMVWCSFQTSHIMYQNSLIGFNISPNNYEQIIILRNETDIFALCNFSHLLLKSHLAIINQSQRLIFKKILLQCIYNKLIKALEKILSFPIITDKIYCGNICQKSFTLLYLTLWSPWTDIYVHWPVAFFTELLKFRIT